MNIIFDKSEIELLDNLWETPTHKKFDDREYYAVVSYSELTKPIVNKLLSWFEKQNNLQLISYNKDLIFHRFYENNYFSRHRDNILMHGKNRAYVVGFHLNNDYEGGEYILYDNNTIIDNTPGVPYCFNSKVEHEIKPVISGVRKSVLIFINHEDIKKNRII